EGELLDVAVADAVDAAVADVGHPGAVGADHEGGAGGAHALELAVLLAERVDAGVGLKEGLAEGGDGALGGVFAVGVRDYAGGFLAGLLADGVGPHAVGDEKEVSLFAPLLQVGRKQDLVVVLVDAAPDADVGQAGVADVVEAEDQGTPRTSRN